MKSDRQAMINYFVSWSGGKDSCLALHRAIKKYGKPKLLVTQLTEEGEISRSHGLTKALLQRQADVLDIPIHFNRTSWRDYEATFVETLKALRKEGISLGVFGDLKIASKPDWKSHRQWADTVCQIAGMRAEEPLWNDTHEEISHDFFNAGFIAKIVSVNARVLNQNYLGRILTHDLLKEFKALGIDPFGEEGEYHTVVVDGPIFNESLAIEERGQCLRQGYYFLDIGMISPSGSVL